MKKRDWMWQKAFADVSEISIALIKITLLLDSVIIVHTRTHIPIHFMTATLFSTMFYIVKHFESLSEKGYWDQSTAYMPACLLRCLLHSPLIIIIVIIIIAILCLKVAMWLCSFHSFVLRNPHLPTILSNSEAKLILKYWHLKWLLNVGYNSGNQCYFGL